MCSDFEYVPDAEIADVVVVYTSGLGECYARHSLDSGYDCVLRGGNRICPFL